MKKKHCQNNSKISSYNLKNRGMINTTNTQIHGRLRAWRSILRHSYHVDWLIVEWMSDCYLAPHELLYSCTLARTSYIRWDDDDDDIWFVLDQPAELDCVMLAHCSNSPRVDMSLHSDTLSWLRATQSALTPQWYVLTEATKTNCIVFGLKRQRHLRLYTLINCRQNMSDHCKLYTICNTS
jgi:hypothetical protein